MRRNNEFESYSNYTIEGNTSSLNISVNNLIATIIIPLDYKVGSFEIVFYGYKGKEVVEEYYSSGGSEEEPGDGGYYTYPWRKKKEVEINETTPNQTTQPIPLPDELIEQLEKDINWLALCIVIGLIILITLVIIIFKRLKKKRNGKKNN